MSEQINSILGSRLLALTRQKIGQRLGLVDGVDQPDLADKALGQSLATFVTLKIDGQLRGCIGNLEPVDSLLESVTRNGLQAAFHDHRFSPLKPEEFNRISIDISILSSPEPLAYKDGDDLLARLKPGVDGIILKLGKARATFLPQVWKQLPQPRAFMEHLCLKAGLARSAWRDQHPDIFIYQVQSFKEDPDAADS